MLRSELFGFRRLQNIDNTGPSGCETEDLNSKSRRYFYPKSFKKGALARRRNKRPSSLEPLERALTQTVRAALALAQDGHPAVGSRAALRETLNGSVVAGAAGAGVGFPGVAGQQHVPVVGDAVLLLAAVDRQQRAFVCGGKNSRR